MEFEYKGKKYELGLVVEPTESKDNIESSLGIVVIFTNENTPSDECDIKDYEKLEKDLEIEIKEAKRKGATPKELRGIQNEYREKINCLSQRRLVSWFYADNDDLITQAKSVLNFMEIQEYFERR